LGQEVLSAGVAVVDGITAGVGVGLPRLLLQRVAREELPHHRVVGAGAQVDQPRARVLQLTRVAEGRRDLSGAVRPAVNGPVGVVPLRLRVIGQRTVGRISARLNDTLETAIAYRLLLLNSVDIAAITRNATSTTPLRLGHMVMIIPITIPRTTNAPAFRRFLGHK